MSLKYILSKNIARASSLSNVNNFVICVRCVSAFCVYKKKPSISSMHFENTHTHTSLNKHTRLTNYNFTKIKNFGNWLSHIKCLHHQPSKKKQLKNLFSIKLFVHINHLHYTSIIKCFIPTNTRTHKSLLKNIFIFPCTNFPTRMWLLFIYIFDELPNSSSHGNILRLRKNINVCNLPPSIIVSSQKKKKSLKIMRAQTHIYIEKKTTKKKIY